MKADRLASIVLVAALAVAAGAHAETPIPPAPARWVTDGAGFLGAPARDELDRRLGDYARATGHQVLVYVGLTTGGVPIEDWAVKAFGAWRVGRKGLDDGLALFVFSADRQLRIEVGYGLEPVMTDSKASRIIRDVIVPRIQSGDRDGAMRAGVDAVLKTMEGPADGPAPVPAASRFTPAQKRTLWIVLLGFAAIPVLLLLLFGLVVMFPGLLPSRKPRDASRAKGGESDREGPAEIDSTSARTDGDEFSGGGGRSGGGGASGSW